MLPWSKPKLFGKEKKYIADALNSSWISGGKYINQLENKLRKFFKVKFAFLVSSGTAAIHLSFLSIDLKPKDEVIVPGFGYMAAANIAKLMGLKVKFADVDKKTYCVSLKSIKSVVTNKTKAVVLIHTYGNIFEINKIKLWCKSKKIKLIEDAAESFGSRFKNKLAGTFGDIGTFSLHATKNITTGEGGIIITNDKQIASKIKLYRSHGVDKKRYYHIVPGHNFRLTNFQAAMGLAQFSKLNVILKYRKKIYKKYLTKIDKDKFYFQQVNKNVNFIPWTIALLPKRKQKKHILKIMNNLLKKGIETRNGFYSANRINYFNANQKLIKNSDYLSKNIICLPLYFDLKNRDILKISSEINKIFL